MTKNLACLVALCILIAPVASSSQPTDDTGGQSSPGEDGESKPPDRAQRSASIDQISSSTRPTFPYEPKNPDPHFHPTLVGFRCQGEHYVDSYGVSVIEANRPVTLTLYGELFTVNTIVAFTTEFQQDMWTGNEEFRQFDESSTDMVIRTLPGARESRNIALTSSATSDKLINSTKINQSDRKLGRRTISKSYDCTDYNRVTSYRMTAENILTPTVAVLTVTLPELESQSNYYFCIKQPAQLVPSALQERSVGPSSATALNRSDDSDNLIWVHQGTEFWVTLKVEPPFMTVTNDILLMILLLFLSAVTSGLNLGLMSLDMNELAVISSCGDQRERSYARTIAPLRKRGNYLLCSLLLGNVMVNATLTVILEQLTSGVVAVIGSTLAIVVLGEIVPQAFCARQGLAIGAKTIYLTYAFMIITFPLSWPISCMLDFFLGEEKGNVYDRERLMEFIRITGHHTQLEADEVAIISGALKLKKIKVDQIMTKIQDVFMLPINCTLDRETIRQIIEKGYSRIPVYEFDDRKQIVGLILAKDLALLDPDDRTPLANMLMYCKHPLIFIEEDATLDVALNEFKTGKSHMAVVRQIFDDGETDKFYEAIGVVTLEDVIEEVLQTEINDETDTLSDNRRKRRRTDAQVSNLMIEELTSRTGSSDTPTVDCELGRPSYYSQLPEPLSPAPSAKMLPPNLSSQLTSVSISGIAQSLTGTNQQAPGPAISGASVDIIQQPESGQQQVPPQFETKSQK